MITKDELAAMIAALESQPHLSIKEEKYLAVCKELATRRFGGRSMPPHEFSQMVNGLRDVPAVQSKRELIVSVLRAFNIKARHNHETRL